MKKAFKRAVFRFFSVSLLLGCLFVFFACGLDQYEVIASPGPVINEIAQNYIDDSLREYADNYVSFHTNELSDYGTVSFIGTDVYYKIYSNYDTMRSETTRLKSYEDSSTDSSRAPTYLMSTYLYKQLRSSSDYTAQVLIPSNKQNREVLIRLTDYQDGSEYAARIEIRQSADDGGSVSGIPLRSFDELTFDFGRSSQSNQKNQIPVSGTDEDVSTNTTVSKENVWYVALFAVGVAMDTSYTSQYSNILYLGYITIDASSEDN